MATIEEIAHQIIEQQMGEVWLVYSLFTGSLNYIKYILGSVIQ